MSGILGEYTEVFLEESEDQIEELNANLLRFEQDYTNKEIINDIFRAAHSFKGSAAFVGLYNLSELAHKMENLLQQVREDKISVNLTLVNLLFECFDLIKEVIDSLGQGHVIDTPFTEMIQKLEDYEQAQASGIPTPTTPKAKDLPKEEPQPSPIQETTVSTPPLPVEPQQVLPSLIELSPEEEFKLAQEEKSLKVSAFEIQVVLKADTPMKGSRYALIIQSLKEIGSVFKSIPYEEELLKGGDIPELKFLFLTQADEEQIRKIISSDLLESLNIKHRNGKAYQKFGFESLPLDQDEVQEIEEEVKIRNGRVYDVCVTLKPDTQMKGLRFTLILQNLKSNSIVYKSNPEIEVLEKGTDVPCLNFILISELGEETLKKQMYVDMIDEIIIKPRKVQSEISLEEAKTIASSSPREPETRTESKASAPSATASIKKEKVVTIDKDKEGGAASKSIKVSSEKLDQLMNNVGELVITNSGFQKIYDDLVRTFGDDTIFAELKSKIDQINRISKDLQAGIMNTRMVPIGTVFNRFSRLVRDLSIETGKKVQLNLLGENTELDKKVVDMISEPLLHLIRNSIDHGIEPPDERIKLGKPEYGTVELNAYQGGNNIMVEIKDDGRGLNKAKILKKAIEVGLTTPAEAQNLSDNDIYQFIFAPGFSTAAQITDISGRGVGMNVVNKLIQDFKGKILINTQEGVGTSFTLCFPQALAIIPSILVSMEEEIYAFPLSEVFETIRVQQEQINTLEGHEIINLRGEVLPIYRLNRIIGLSERPNVMEFPVVIVNYNTRKLGFIVDELIGKHETVIKTLEKNFRNIPGLTGASIMGDGTIILVLDIPGLIELTNTHLLKYADLGGKEMPRLNVNRTADITASTMIYKTSNPTNLYNTKLYEMLQSDKSKRKKEKSIERKKVQEIKKQETVEIVEEVEETPSTPEILEEQPQSTASLKQEETTTNGSLPEFQPSSSPHIEPVDDEHLKAKELLKSLSEQTHSRYESLLGDRPIEQLLTKTEIRKLETVVNTGMMNAGLVLSQLVGSNVELYMPEIKMTDKDELVHEIREPNENHVGLKVRMNGELNGNLLMIFSEERGSEIANKLLKSNETSDLAKKLSDDSISVLMEISNIVCSSVINSLSNKARVQILPSVPELYTGTFREVLDAVKPEKTKFLCMNTEFVYEGDNMIGNLIFLPDFDELTKLIAKLN